MGVPKNLNHPNHSPLNPNNPNHLQLWVLAAKLEVRARRLDAARRILGMAVGMAPKDKTYKAYIELELMLGNVDR